MALDDPRRGGVAPAAATDTTLLTQGAGQDAAIWVTATNRDTTDAVIRIAVRPLGAALTTANYDLFDFPLPGFDSIKRGPFSLLGTDIITVRASTANVTFRFDGWEEP